MAQISCLPIHLKPQQAACLTVPLGLKAHFDMHLYFDNRIKIVKEQIWLSSVNNAVSLVEILHNSLPFQRAVPFIILHQVDSEC